MPQVDLLVIGGGLAGVLAAEVGLGARRDVTVLEHGRRRASDTPCALVHPFAGGSFRPREDVEEVWTHAKRWFGARDRWCQHAVARRYLPQTRPGERLLKTWPLIEPLARTMFEHVVGPTVAADRRWVEYGPVFAVDLRGLVAAERDVLQSAGVAWRNGRARKLQRCANAWTLLLEGGESITASTVVLAAGAGARTLLEPWTSVDALEMAEGTLLCGPPRTDTRFVLHGGHASSSPAALAWGASYRMLDGDDRDPHAELLAIDQRLREAGADLPPLDVSKSWSGVRLVDQKARRPWVREVTTGLFAFCGFGSQGCFWGPWASRRLADALVGH